MDADDRSVADIEGPWVDPGIESGLIARCRQNWYTPIAKLSNQMLATFIRQELGLAAVIPEATRRVQGGFNDDSELFERELSEVLARHREWQDS